MTLVNRKTREILGYDIACDRSLQRVQNLVDNASKAEFYFSDAFPVYSQICYDGVYRALNNKSQTFFAVFKIFVLFSCQFFRGRSGIPKTYLHSKLIIIK